MTTEIASPVTDIRRRLEFTHDTLREACEFLTNGTPIRNGSHLHGDLVVAGSGIGGLMTQVRLLEAAPEMLRLLLLIGDTIASDHPHDWTEDAIKLFEESIREVTAKAAGKS